MADTTASKTGTKKVNRSARIAGFACFRAIMKQNQPDITKEQRKAAWEASKEQYTKLGRRIIAGLKRKGYRVVKTAGAKGAVGAAKGAKSAKRKAA